MLEREEASILDLAPDILTDIPLWNDFFTAVGQVFTDTINSPLDQLSSIRKVEASIDPAVARATARLLGFNVAQDIMVMSSNNLTKLVTQLPLYSLHSSTEKFVNFISLLIDGNVAVTYLWTTDYVNFSSVTPKEQDQVVHGGRWFKTMTIDVNVSLRSPELALKYPGRPLFNRVLSAFYQFCPAQLVIRNLDFGQDLEAELGFIAALDVPTIQIEI